MSDQLIREALPFQAGPLSPVPQYWNASTNAYEKVQGANGGTNVNLPVGAATEATLLAIAMYVDGIEALLAMLGTQTTSAAILAKLSSDPATQTTLAAVLAKLSADPATQTTLAALLAKFGSLGQKTMSGSAPVTFASDQSPLSTTRNGLALTTVTHSLGAAGLSSSTALAANASRKYALFVNDSSNVIYLFEGATAFMNQGIRLNANGGSYEIDERNLYTGIVTCISSATSQNLLVTQGV